MRLGAYECIIKENTKMYEAYRAKSIFERHRHRYEFNNDYREMLEKCGLTVCGTSPDGSLVEAVELSDKLFHLGVQYHPEFKSRPHKPHPLFVLFIRQALAEKRSKK